MTVMTVLSTQGFVVLSPRILTSPQFSHFLNSVLSTQYLLTVHPSRLRIIIVMQGFASLARAAGDRQRCVGQQSLPRLMAGCTVIRYRFLGSDYVSVAASALGGRRKLAGAISAQEWAMHRKEQFKLAASCQPVLGAGASMPWS